MQLALGLAESGTVHPFVSRVAATRACIQITVSRRFGGAVIRTRNILTELTLIGGRAFTSLMVAYAAVLARCGAEFNLTTQS